MYQIGWMFTYPPVKGEDPVDILHLFSDEFLHLRQILAFNSGSVLKLLEVEIVMSISEAMLM